MYRYIYIYIYIYNHDLLINRLSLISMTEDALTNEFYLSKISPIPLRCMIVFR